MRIPVRDFYTMAGALSIVFGVFSTFVMGGEDILICTVSGLIIGIPLLIIGLNKQSKYSQAIYGDNRLVKCTVWGMLGGLLLAYLLIRYSGN